MFGMGATEFLIVLVFVALPVVLWLIALISILRNDFVKPSDKIVWFLVVFLLPLLGALLYIFIGRNKTVKYSKEVG